MSTINNENYIEKYPFKNILDNIDKLQQIVISNALTNSLINTDLNYSKIEQIANDLYNTSQYIYEIVENNSKNIIKTIQLIICQFLQISLIDNCEIIFNNININLFIQSLINIINVDSIKNAFNNDENDDDSRKTFYSLFNILNLNGIIKYLSDDEYISFKLSNSYEYFLKIIISLLIQTSKNIIFVKNDLKNQEFILKLLVKYVDNYLTVSTLSTLVLEQQEHERHPILCRTVSVQIILSFFYNMIDKTILVPNFINTNYHEFVIKWINIENLQIDDQRTIISIIHDLAQHDLGAEALNKCHAIQVLKEFKKRLLNVDHDEYQDLKLFYCMIISLLSDPKENKEDPKSMNKILNQLLQTAIDASLSKNFISSNGFHINEPIVVLTKLCVHDDILHYILNEAKVNKPQTSIVQFISDLLIHFRGALATEDETDQMTCIALFNLVWSISFHEQYIEELKSNTKFLLTVKSLANDDGEALIEQYVPKHMASVKQAANGILWNLDENNPARVLRTSTSVTQQAAVENEIKSQITNKGNRVMVMISYSHADVKFCQQLVTALKQDEQLDIWVDFSYCHTEDLWEEIGIAIEKADVVLFLLTKDYFDSKSCRQEVMYAKDSLKKRFIPVYAQKEYIATGWLGVRIVGPQYVRFGKKAFDSTVVELKKLILDDGNSEKIDVKKRPSITVPVHTETIKKVEQINAEKKPFDEGAIEWNTKTDDNLMMINEDLITKPLHQWTFKDVTRWFNQNRIKRELRDLYEEFYSGTDLIFYYQSLKADWQTEYLDIRERYLKKYDKTLYRDQFVRLVSALDRLSTDRCEVKSTKKSKSLSMCSIV